MIYLLLIKLKRKPSKPFPHGDYFDSQVWIRIPMESPSIQAMQHRKDITNKEELQKEKESDTWEWYVPLAVIHN